VSEDASAAPGPRLPYRAADVQAGGALDALAVERTFGNGDLVRVFDALGIAGPFRRLSPWELEDPRGRHLVHAGGYAALPFGEGPPALVAAARTYLETFATPAFAQQAASEARAALAANLVALLAHEAPRHTDDRVLFSNSGAEAIEIALKLLRASKPDAPWILTFDGGYHGKTMGALSITPTEEYQAAFRPLLPGIRSLPYGDLDAVERELLVLGADQVAGIVVEPVQGEGGVVTPPEGFLPGLRSLGERYGVAIVADEIQTGLGRTGHWFASVAGGLDPDVVTLAKPLSGGLVPIGATIARPEMMEAMLPGFSSRRHSSTFAGNALAMHVGLAALETLVDGRYDLRAREAGARGRARLDALAERRPGLLREVRSSGMLFALVLHDPVAPGLLGNRPALARLLASGLGVRSLHRQGVHAIVSLAASGVVRLTPALDMPDELQATLWDRVDAFGAAFPQAWRLAASAGPARLARLASIATRGGPHEGRPAPPSQM